MFFVVAVSVLVAMHLYLWVRLVRDTTRTGRPRRALTGVLIALALLVLAANVLARVPGPDQWVAWPGYLWLGLAVYLVLALLVLEPIRFIARRRIARREKDSGAEETDEQAISRRLFLARTGAAVAGAASVGLVGYGAATALGPPDLLRVPVRLRRLDPALRGYRIAVVADIHLGPLLGRGHTERIVEMINAAEPDLVAMVGDLVDDTVAELGSAAAPLRDLVARDGAFFVTGNHEYFVDDTADWLRELQRLGMTPLRNENTVVRRGGAVLNLAGVNDLSGARRDDGPDLDRALDGLNPDAPTVLMAHQPVMVGQAAARGVDLQLSGHTHGGQMWPFHYVVEAVQPSLAGLSTVQETQLYVTRGAGFWGPPVRVGARPDITILTLE
ncbi:putative phosphohydrolase [Mycolicibacterium phlei]|uniref:Metallophosphatase n=1 Tax=Mycolicibacterium phlei DSM 43239 = CCUG 21000 TaxID=1226750 RepID=A0A5N5V071_MYCPH|nr:metallophosphoesterase [Mycolicibacterium phlei]VEG11897.1 putative phosphohydrolase [Mycobacteroides chelonae]AMO63806.1 putative metallophosphoesterase [Mycolicibacterium phlei]KAB7753890.1 metallophosphatase [Mycolicibacterium phlei DSM 43239 = CCUG 21000]KXW65443.1 metallophosphatase [Mycolicibacterium phlei DSM 43239 = CCUG 21000]KXW65793.1 metallophosphatase [Mycolicibacterium phlei DSM 43070]